MSRPIEACESELYLIGGAMLSPEDMAETFERVSGEHFFDPLHRRLWEWMRRQGGRIDMALVWEQFQRDEQLVREGGAEWLFNVLDKASTYNVEAHADAVIDAYTRRCIQQLGSFAQGEAEKRIGDGEHLLAEIERGAAEIAREGVQRSHGVPVGLNAVEMLEVAYSGGFAGSSVGLDVLDHVTGGIRQDDVWFIGGRTSMGKSVTGLCVARGIAEHGRGVLFFSLEMPLREVQARMIADIAYDRRVIENGADGGNVRYGDILKGRGSPQQIERANRAARKLASLPFVVNDAGGLTIDDIRSQAQRQFRAWDRAGVPRGALLIDHIGLVKGSGRRNDSKAAETADIVNELKGLAKQLGAPVIALCQVNRNTESRENKRPTLADLNWSGAIEQIADFICLLYRDAYYLERSTVDGDDIKAVHAKYDLELLIQKNRSGPICNLKAFADVSCNAVRDLEPTHERRFG